jgi:hypothetical protein
VARETWNLHPDQLMGAPFEPYMLTEMMALALIEHEEIKR